MSKVILGQEPRDRVTPVKVLLHKLIAIMVRRLRLRHPASPLFPFLSPCCNWQTQCVSVNIARPGGNLNFAEEGISEARRGPLSTHLTLGRFKTFDCLQIII